MMRGKIAVMGFIVIIVLSLTAASCSAKKSSVSLLAGGRNPVVLQNGSVKVSYWLRLQIDGASTSGEWSVASGALPNGLKLNDSTGIISGVPMIIGKFDFVVQQTVKGALTLVQPCSITITDVDTTATVAPRRTIITSSLSDGTVGKPYSEQLHETNGSDSDVWLVSEGSLPDGLELNKGSGIISGTPTTAGRFNFTVSVNGGTDTAYCFLSIYIASVPLEIITKSLPDGTVGVDYSQPIVAQGGSSPYSWAIASGPLPDGLHADAITCLISGTPTTPGTYNFAIKVTSGIETYTQSYTVTINASN